MDHATLFQALDQLLTRHQEFWRFQAFHQTSALWLQHDDLWNRLQALPANTLSNDNDNRARFLQPWINDSEVMVRLCEVPQLSKEPRLADQTLAVPTALSYAVPGRKWQQILSFAALVPSQHHIIEWCAGHGHLGRLLAAQGATSVTSLEWNRALCERGQQLARRAGLSVHFDHVDVMTSTATRRLHTDCHAVALHACGDLHTRLLQSAAEQKTRALTVAPCCYHLTDQAIYQPLSSAAQLSTLTLTRADLRLAVKVTVTAGAAARRKADQEVGWRLGFDSWQRVQRNADDYLPLPALPQPLLRGSFHHFVQWAAAVKTLPPPTEMDSAHYERLGQQRFHITRRMEWLQQLFSRPLELWLLLDRVLYLQEQGYRVDIGTFCDDRVTPRNLVICARS